MFLARERRRGAPWADQRLPPRPGAKRGEVGRKVPFDPEGAVHFGDCNGPVLFSGRGAGGYPVIPPGVDGRGWLLWHWPWSQWDARPVAEGGDGPWQTQVTFVPSGFKII